MDQRIPVAALGVAALPAALVLHAADPTQGIGIPCPFRAVTGWLCPGCGSARALHHLLHGDVTLAIAHNPLVPVAVVVFGALYLAWAIRVFAPMLAERLPVGGGPLHPPGWVGMMSAVGLGAFAIARNTAAGTWLSPLA